ncbi:hypothetical protein GC089_16700 [Cellulomonas sp. JZ18]|uniref:hypothetical protein n=1 Tax=Cellulomonas sp. JZ18 TaxID=2654191 RepID=UPI0012D3CF45|nr:hypothetical protein [Cellulomonas sp. JZ18]QGQ20526.1 hypothetical protein GC089_16700 [Cellulomonas sp. JZ18]
MRVDGTSSLVVSSTNASGLTTVLYLRDRVDPSALGEFPPLTPAVRPLPRVDVPAGAWQEWVADVERAPTAGLLVAPRTPVLAELLERHRCAAADWRDEHDDDGVIARYRPSWLSPLLAARGGHGAFACEVLPVRGVWWRDVSPRRVLVSQAAYDDHALMDRLWRERIVRLLP